MNSSPSIDNLIEGVIHAIGDELLPNLGDSPKAQATAAMAQSVLQGVRQMLEVADQNIALDHNEMVAAFRQMADDLGEAEGDAADRVRERCAQYGAVAEVPAPPDREAIMATHLELGHALEATLPDLDELIRAGEERGQTALDTLRAHLAQRYQRDAAAIIVGEGMIGRG